MESSCRACAACVVAVSLSLLGFIDDSRGEPLLTRGASTRRVAPSSPLTSGRRMHGFTIECRGT